MLITAAGCRLYRSTGITLVDCVDNPEAIQANHIDLEVARVNTTANAAELLIDYPVIPADDSQSPIYDVDFCRIDIGGNYYYYFVYPLATTRLSARTVKMTLRLDSISSSIANGIEVTGRLSRIHSNELEDVWWGSETDEPITNMYPQRTTFQDIDLNPDNNWTQLIVSAADLKYSDLVSHNFVDYITGNTTTVPAQLVKPPPEDTQIKITAGSGTYTYKLGKMAVYNYKVIRDNRETDSWELDQGLTSLQLTGNTNFISDSYLLPSDYIEEDEPDATLGYYTTLTAKQVNTEAGDAPELSKKIRKQIRTPLVPYYGFNYDTGVNTVDFAPGTSQDIYARLMEYMKGGCLKAFYEQVTHTLVSWATGQHVTTSAANLRGSGSDTTQVAKREFPTGSIPSGGEESDSGCICPMLNRVAITLLCNPGPKGCLYIKYSQIWDTIPASLYGLNWTIDGQYVTGISTKLEQSVSNAGWSSYGLSITGSPGYLVNAMDTYFNKAQNFLGAQANQLTLSSHVQTYNKNAIQNRMSKAETGLGTALEGVSDALQGTTNFDDGLFTSQGLGYQAAKGFPASASKDFFVAGFTNANEIELQNRISANRAWQAAMNDKHMTASSNLQAMNNYAVLGANSDITTALLLNMCVQLRCSFNDPRDVLEHCRYFLMFGYSDGRTVMHRNLKDLIANRRRYFCYVQFDYASVRILNQRPGLHQNIKEDIAERLVQGVRIWHLGADVPYPDAPRYYINNGFPNTAWTF